MKLKNLTNDGGHHLSRHVYGETPASYLFVETVIRTGILGEAANERLTQILQSATGRLQNFMTPGASSDLESILGFLAPKGGGLAKVKEMVGKAGQLQTPVLNDQSWWQELFTVFNIQDKTVQQQIIAKTGQSAGEVPGQAIQPPVGQQQPVGQQPPQPGQQPNRGPTQGQVQANQADLTAKMAKNTEDRKASAARIQDLQSRIAALKAKRGVPTSESIWGGIATALLNEADVKSNLRFVASNLMRRLGYISTTPVQEVNWLKRFVGDFDKPVQEGGFKDFFRNLRTMAANPAHLSQKVQNSALKSFNERAAKLAIQHLSDHVTAEMHQRLKVAGLEVKDIARTMTDWRALQTQYQQARASGAAVPAALEAKFRATADQIERITYALDPSLAQGATP